MMGFFYAIFAIILATSFASRQSHMRGHDHSTEAWAAQCKDQVQGSACCRVWWVLVTRLRLLVVLHTCLSITTNTCMVIPLSQYTTQAEHDSPER